MGLALQKDTIAERINFLHGKVIHHKKMTLEAMMECGRLLISEKHKRTGQFLWWLEKNVNFSERTAHKYMRVYRLHKQGYWDKDDTVANNLARNAEPQTFAQCVTQSRAEEISLKHGIKMTTAKTIVKAMDKIPEAAPIIQIINSLSEEQKTKLRIKLFEAMERSYDLGRRNKILPISEKRDYFEKLLGVIEK